MAQAKETATDTVIPERILKYMKNRDVTVFMFSRSLQKNKKCENEFKELWAINTFLIVPEPFPTVIRILPIIDKVEVTLSPVQNALNSMTSKNAQLRALNERFDTGEGGVVSQMTMVLNGTIDAAVNGGVKKYMEAFCTREYLAEYPDNKGAVKELQDSMVEQVAILRQGLRVHRRICGAGMMQLQEHLEAQLEKIREDVERCLAATEGLTH